MRSAALFLASAVLATLPLSAATVPDRAATLKVTARAPLSFESAGEQWIARGANYGIALNAAGATVHLPSDTLEMRFVQANATAVAKGEDPLPGKMNYLIGRDPSHWVTNKPTYGRVAFADVYKGVRVVWYGNQSQLEYDLVLAPGADPNQIHLRFAGAKKVTLTKEGEIQLATSRDPLVLRAPVLYQQNGEQRTPVSGHYVLTAENEVAFQTGPYDSREPLVIDPTIAYGTYFANGPSINGIAVDAEGSVYIAGTADIYSFIPEVNFVNAPNKVGFTLSSTFVTKYDHTGTAILYSAMIGGSGGDKLTAMAVNGEGELVATGNTASSDFPIVNAEQPVHAGPSDGSLDGFVYKVNANGTGLVFSTYLGGSGNDYPTGLAVDSNGSVYVTCSTTSRDFPATAGAFRSSGSHFAVRLSSAGALIYSTALPSSPYLQVPSYEYSVVADPSGSAYVAGEARVQDFPGNLPGMKRFSGTPNPASNGAFVTKVSPDGAKLLWFAFLDGVLADEYAPGLHTIAIARDPHTGTLYIGGGNSNGGVPVTPGAQQSSLPNNAPAVIASLLPDGSAFGFVTYLGGSGQEYAGRLTVTDTGQLVVTGSTYSEDFPLLRPVQPTLYIPGTLYSSSDSGVTWQRSDMGLPSPPEIVLPSPVQEGTLFAGNGSAGYRSTDGGQHWRQTIAFNPDQGLYFPLSAGRSLSDPAVIYAFAEGSVAQKQIFRSDDDGQTWHNERAWSTNVGNIVISPSDANTLVIFTGSYPNNPVYRSTDGGATVTQLPSSAGPGSGLATRDGSMYQLDLLGVWKSTDNGLHWARLPGSPHGTPPPPGPVVAGVQETLSASLSNPAVLYVANCSTTDTSENGVFKTEDGGKTWVSLPGAAGKHICSVAVSASNPNLAFGAGPPSGTDENAGVVDFFTTSDGGNNWRQTSSAAGFLPRVFGDPLNSSCLYAVGVTPTTSQKMPFIAKYTPAGKLIWSTLYGGVLGTTINAVAGRPGTSAIWIAGSTYGGALPITSNTRNSGYTLPLTNLSRGSAFLTDLDDSTASCSYTTLSPQRSILGNDVSTRNIAFTVTAPSGCAWSASVSDSSWIKIAGPSSGSGSASLQAYLVPNPGTQARTGSITVNGQTLAITEPGANCTYSFSTPDAPKGGADAPIDVTAPAGCPWTVTPPSSDFARIVSGASGTGNGRIVVRVAPNPYPTPREFVLNVGGYAAHVLQH